MSHQDWNPDEKSLRAIDIHTLLPQQKPFVMVDTLTGFSRKGITTETVVRADNMLAEAGHLSAEGVMENIAQTCAARIGFVNRYILRRGIQVGFIGAIRNFHIHRLPETGETITTDVRLVEEIFGMVLASATVTGERGPVAETEIKIALDGGDAASAEIR